VYWQARGHGAEGAGVLRALLDAPAAQSTTLLRARALGAAADLLHFLDGNAIAADYCQEGLAIARAVGDDYLVADLLYEQAWVLLRQGQPAAALPLLEQGLSLARRLQEPHLTARLLSPRSYATYIAGDHAGAASDTAESLRLFRQAGDRILVGTALTNLGYIELSAGDLGAARGHLAEALDIARAFNNRSDIVHGTFNLGLAEYLGGSPDTAEALCAESFDLGSRLGMKRQIAYALLGLAMTGSGADLGRAARLHGAADQALADLGETIDPLEGRLAGLDRQRLRAAMGTEAFEAAYAAGRTLDMARVAHEALPGTQAGRAAQRAGAPVREQDTAVPGEAGAVLTPREIDVLKLVAQGLSNSDIARRLFLSEHTVHRHLANILRKLDLSSRAAAAAWGTRAGLI